MTSLVAGRRSSRRMKQSSSLPFYSVEAFGAEERSVRRVGSQSFKSNSAIFRLYLHMFEHNYKQDI
jgi:hypothetical protein